MTEDLAFKILYTVLGVLTLCLVCLVIYGYYLYFGYNLQIFFKLWLFLERGIYGDS